MDFGLVAIIVPAYNMERYLAKCLDSVLAQSYSNLDVIVVDDGSTDGTPGIVAEYVKKDSRVRVITEANGGLSVARNTALAALRQETAFVYFVDSDDYLPDGAIEAMLACMEENHGDVVIGQYVNVEENGDIFKTSPPTGEGLVEVIDRAEMFHRMTRKLLPKYTVAHSKLYRRHVLDGFQFPAGKVYEDSFIHRIYGKCDKIVFLNKVIYCYLRRIGSIVNSGYDIRRLDKVENLIDRIDYLRKNGYAEDSAYCFIQTYKLLLDTVIYIGKIDNAVKKRVEDLRRLLEEQRRQADFSCLTNGERSNCKTLSRHFWLVCYRWKFQHWLMRMLGREQSSH